MKFLVQLNEKTLLPQVEGLTLIDACNFQNWKAGKDKHKVYFGLLNRPYVYKDIKDAARDDRSCTDDIKDMVPVGTVEFVNYALHERGHKPVRAINIPMELRKDDILNRFATEVPADKLADVLDEHPKLVVKPNTQSKKFDALVIKSPKDLMVTDESYFVSDLVDIVAEWRVFVHNGRVMDYRMYGETMNIPIDIEFVKQCIREFTDCPPSYTLDIGKLNNMKNTVIEVHNFISCGLYGFEGPELVNMTIDGWLFELNRE